MYTLSKPLYQFFDRDQQCTTPESCKVAPRGQQFSGPIRHNERYLCALLEHWPRRRLWFRVRKYSTFDSSSLQSSGGKFSLEECCLTGANPEDSFSHTHFRCRKILSVRNEHCRVFLIVTQSHWSQVRWRMVPDWPDRRREALHTSSSLRASGP